MAEKLAEFKVSRVSVSIDSMDEKIHDEIRGKKILEKSNRGFGACTKCWYGPLSQYNCRSLHANTQHFKELLDYSKNKKYKTLLNVAVPSGMWQKMDDIIYDDKDREYLRKIRKEYKNLVRNVWNLLIKITKKF